MEILTLAIPPVVISLIVQLGKMIGVVRPGWAKVAVFILAIAFGCLFYYNQGWSEVVVTVLAFGLTAIGVYEAGLKPATKALNLDGKPGTDTPQT